MIRSRPHALPRIAGTALLPLLFVGFTGAVATAGPHAGAARDHSASRSVQLQLETLPPIQAGALTVVPLRASGLPNTSDVLGHPTLIRASVVKQLPAGPILRLENPTSRPLLVTAGRVVHTENVDLIIARDMVVPPGTKRTVDTLAADDDARALRVGTAVRWSPRWAPPKLRETVLSKERSYDLDSFLSLFRDTEAGGDRERPGLREVISSDVARHLDQSVAKILHDERFRADDVVGFVSGVHGEAVSLQLFGSSQLNRKKASGLLESLGIHAAAVEWRAEGLGLELLAGDAASQAVAASAERMLRALRTQRVQVEREGDHLVVRAPDLLGHGIKYEGELVHLALFVRGAGEIALFSRPFPPGAASRISLR